MLRFVQKSMVLDGWVGRWWSLVKDCLQQSKTELTLRLKFKSRVSLSFIICFTWCVFLISSSRVQAVAIWNQKILKLSGLMYFITVSVDDSYTVSGWNPNLYGLQTLNNYCSQTFLLSEIWHFSWVFNYLIRSDWNLDKNVLGFQTL